MTRFVLSTFSVGSIVLGANVACSQNYPNKPIRIVTNEIGGTGDIATRLIAPGMSELLGQPVIVDNRAGSVTAEILTRAAPDGYTLLIHGASVWVGTLLQKMPYDVARDFSPVSLLTRQPNILVVHPSVPVKSVKELIVLAKAKPGELNYGTGSTGAANHLAAELFKSMAGVNIVRVPYKGNGPAINGLISGEVQLSFPSATAVTPQLKSGKLRALAITSAEPSALAPGLPTIAASGLPGYESGGGVVLLARAKTPASIIKRLNMEVVRVLHQADVKEKFFNSGAEAVSSSPEELAAAIKSEMARMGKVIREAGIRLE